jgi:high affinity sulfate transporter 1
MQESPFEPAPRQPFLQRTLPVSRQLRRYSDKAPRDLIAGLTVAALALPAAMAYAELAGISAIHGLYALLLPVVAYAALGSSRLLAIGPEASLSAMTGVAVLGIAAAGSGEAAALAAMLALLTAVCYALALVLRLGWMADYLSRPVLVGYMHGIAIVVVIAQLGKLLGLDIKATDPVPQLAEVIHELGDVNTTTLAVSAIALGVLLPARWVAPRFPTALVVVVGAIIASSALDLVDHGVAVIGGIPSGFPHFDLPSVSWDNVTTLAPAAAALFLFGFADAILTARAFAARHGDRIGMNQELRALAVANAAGGFTQGMPVGASNSRTAMNDAVGARSQLAGVVCAVVILLVLLLLTGPLAHLPKAVLGAAIVAAMVGLVEPDAWRSLAAIDRVEVAIAGVTAAGVVVVGVLQGVAFAVALTIVDAVRRSARPGDAVLGYDKTLGRWADITEHPDAHLEPGVVVYRLESRLFFANASYVRDRIEAAIRGAEPPPDSVVLDCEAISRIDSTGVEMLIELCGRLRRKGVTLLLGRVRDDLRRSLRTSGALDVIGADHVFPTIGAALAARAPDQSETRRS